ncbi:hypothetical protein HN51_052334 [Arachis hypogaea]
MSLRVEGECYVVFRGRTPGIYNTWEAAEQQVSGYPRNLHRRYRSFEAGWRAWVDYMHGHASDPNLHHAVYFTADAESGGQHLCFNSSSHQVSLKKQPTFPNESEYHPPGSDESAIARLQHAVTKLEGRVSQLEDEDSQQVTISPKSRLILCSGVSTKIRFYKASINIAPEGTHGSV